MMLAFVDKSRRVEGRLTSLADIGYLSVGVPDVERQQRGPTACAYAGWHGRRVSAVQLLRQPWTNGHLPTLGTRTRPPFTHPFGHALAYSLTRAPVV